MASRARIVPGGVLSHTDHTRMFISRAELERRKSSEHNVAERLKMTLPAEPAASPITGFDTSQFRRDGSHTDRPLLTNEMRALVACTAIVAGNEVAAEVGNVSPQYAEVLARAEYPRNLADPEEREKRNAELRDMIYKGLSEIREKAQSRLLAALDLINEESLENIPVKDKAKIAANIANQLSSVIDRTINKGEHIHAGASTHLHLYAPERRTIDAFDIKRINAMPTESENAQSSAE